MCVCKELLLLSKVLWEFFYVSVNCSLGVFYVSVNCSLGVFMQESYVLWEFLCKSRMFSGSFYARVVCSLGVFMQAKVDSSASLYVGEQE